MPRISNCSRATAASAGGPSASLHELLLDCLQQLAVALHRLPPERHLLQLGYLLLVGRAVRLLVEHADRNTLAPLARLIPGGVIVGSVVARLIVELVDALLVPGVGVDLVVGHARL